MTSVVDIVAVGAHPDDVELGCGGAIVLAAKGGRKVAIVDITAGERSSRGDPVRRAAERDAASRLLGVARRDCLGLPDGELIDSPPLRNGLIGALRRFRPSVVLAPFPEDRHPDHAAAGRATRAACFLSGVAAIGSDAPHRPVALYHYLLHHSEQPTFVVDITPVWETKWDAITAYVSQFGGDPGHGGSTPLNDGSFLSAVDARAAVAGSMVGVARGEPYWSEGPLAMDELPWTIGGAGSYRSQL